MYCSGKNKLQKFFFRYIVLWDNSVQQIKGLIKSGHTYEYLHLPCLHTVPVPLVRMVISIVQLQKSNLKNTKLGTETDKLWYGIF
jgi:hypothetical protein